MPLNNCIRVLLLTIYAAFCKRIANYKKELEYITTKLIKEYEMGLQVNVEKTKYMSFEGPKGEF